MTNNNYEIVRGRTEMKVPHEKGSATFVSPAIGPGIYVRVKEQLEAAGLIAPTMAQTASLAYTAMQNKEEPEFNDVTSKLDNNWLWAFHGILYTPKGEDDYQNGAIIQDNPQVKNGRVSLVKSELVKKLEAGDKSVRFVPFGYKTDAQKPSELAKNAFVIALAGEEGAEKLAKIAENYRNNPKVWSFGNVDEEIARVSSLDGNYGGDRLDVDGYYFVDGNGGFAFGVSPSADEGSASAPRKIISVEDLLTETAQTSSFAPDQIKKLQNILEQRKYIITTR